MRIKIAERGRKMKRSIASIAVVVLITVAAGNLAAQTIESPTIESPTNSSSAGRFTSTADDFMWMTDWQGVDMEKWFGFASWAGNAAANNAAVLGYAGNFGGLYLAAEYNGTLWGGVWNNAYTEYDGYPAPNAGTSGYKKEYSALDLLTGTQPNNNIGVLIGVADMGFRIFFSSTHNSFKDTEFVAPYNGNSMSFKSYQKDYGYITPQLGWGMAKGLTEQGIQPWVTLDFEFNRDYEKGELFGQSEIVITSNNYFEPRLSLGLGGFSFIKDGNFDASVDLEYYLALRLYSNEFSYSKDGAYTTDKINGLASMNIGSGSLTLTENTYMTNWFSPALGFSWKSDDDRLALRSKLFLGVGLDPESTTEMALNASYSLEKSGNEEKKFTFTFNPELALAAQYQVIPEKLTLSIGGKIGAKLKTTTTEKEMYAAGSAVPNSKSKETNSTLAGTYTSLSAGAAWNLTKNVWLEGQTGVSSGNGNALIGNVTTFGSILAGLKF
jgi:hypothetical protein